MNRILLLAWRYIAFHRTISTILLVSITATLYLPITASILTNRMEQQLFARAETTPLIVGAKGSRFDLTLNALYFEARAPQLISMSEVEAVESSGLASAVPLHIGYRAQGYPLVGTTLEYFDLRKLAVAAGSNLGMLGDCLVGATVAEELGLQPGDRLLSDPENVFDIGGTYPLNMRVGGILEESGSPDDRAVFVDIKTVWVIAGIGHGHQELSQESDSGVLLLQTDSQVVANAALPQYTEVTPGNVGSFHFHSQSSDLPLTALIAVPHDNKSRVLLEGRFTDSGLRSQILRPSRVVEEMMAMVLQIKKIFDAGMLVFAITTGLFLVLVIVLSTRLRKREMHTMFKLGCSRLTIWKLQAAELGMVVFASVVAAGILTVVTLPLATDLIRNLII